MKKFIFSLFVMVFSTIAASAETWTHVFASGDVTALGEVTLGDVVWNVSGTLNASEPYFGFDTSSSARGAQFGSAKKSFSHVTLSTEGFSNIAEVKVTAATAGQAVATISVGGESKDLAMENAEYVWTNVEGNLVIELDQPSTLKALYIAKIEVTTKENVTPTVSYGTFSTSPAPVDGEFVSGTKFYTIKVARDGYLASDRASSGYLTMHNSSKPSNDAGKWAFVETESGLQVYNKAAGAAQVLTFQSDANSSHCSMGGDLTAAASFFECVTTQNPQFLAGYECFKIKDTEAYWNHNNNSPYYLNVWTSNQALWGWGHSADNPSEGDAGSQFKIELVEELVATTYVINVVGATGEVTVSINGTERPVGTPFVLSSSIDADAVTATEIPAYTYEVTIVDGTITVTYTYNPYAVNYDKDGDKKDSARNINSVSLTQEGGALQSFDVTNPGKTYNDMTAQKFTVEAGSTVTPNMVGVGSWYHGYVYVDVDNNGVFDIDETELVSYTAYRQGETGQAHNSANEYFNAAGGTAWSDGVNGKFPSFVAPAAGTYRIRFKTDWNNLDPAGGPTMWTDRGQIIDATLEVVAPAPATVDVAYTVKFGDEVVKTATVTETIGEAPTYDVAAPAYVQVAGMPEVITADTKAVELTTTLDETVPFDMENTYFISLPNGTKEYWLNDNGSGKLNELRGNEDGVTLESLGDDSRWIVGGDWCNGFTLKNVNTGNYVAAGDNHNNGTQVKLGDTPEKYALVEFANGWRFKAENTFLAHYNANSHIVCYHNPENYAASYIQFHKYTAPVEPEVKSNEFVTDGKVYTLTAVTKTQEEYAWTVQNGEIVPVKNGTPAKFTCEFHGDNVAFVTEDGKYLRNHDRSDGGTTWLDAGSQSTTGLSDVYTELCNLTFEHFPAYAANVDYGYSSITADLVAVKAARGTQYGNISMGYFIVTNSGTFTGAATTAPFFNDNLTSAFRLAEYEEPTVDAELMKIWETGKSLLAEAEQILKQNQVTLKYDHDGYFEDIESPIVGKVGYKAHDVVFNVADAAQYLKDNYEWFPTIEEMKAYFDDMEWPFEFLIEPLQNVIDEYKAAEVVLPEKGKTYIIRLAPDQYSWAYKYADGSLGLDKWANVKGDLTNDYIWTCEGLNDFVYENDFFENVTEPRYQFSAYNDASKYLAWKKISGADDSQSFWKLSGKNAPEYGVISMQAFDGANINKYIAIQVYNATMDHGNGSFWTATSQYSSWFYFEEFEPIVKVWDGEAPTVAVVDDATVTVKFNNASKVEATNFGVLGAMFNESGDLEGIVFDALFGNCVEFDGDQATLHFKKISEINAELQGAAKSVAAKALAAVGGQAKGQVVILGKSFKVDEAAIYQDVIVADYSFGGTQTGINAATLAGQNRVFDLNGRRVREAKNGLFLLEGKKVVK